MKKTEILKLVLLFEYGGNIAKKSAECCAFSAVTKNKDAKRAYKCAVDLYSAAEDILEDIRSPLFEMWLQDENKEEGEPETEE